MAHKRTREELADEDVRTRDKLIGDSFVAVRDYNNAKGNLVVATLYVCPALSRVRLRLRSVDGDPAGASTATETVLLHESFAHAHALDIISFWMGVVRFHPGYKMCWKRCARIM